MGGGGSSVTKSFNDTLAHWEAFDCPLTKTCNYPWQRSKQKLDYRHTCACSAQRSVLGGGWIWRTVFGQRSCGLEFSKPTPSWLSSSSSSFSLLFVCSWMSTWSSQSEQTPWIPAGQYSVYVLYVCVVCVQNDKKKKKPRKSYLFIFPPRCDYPLFTNQRTTGYLRHRCACKHDKVVPKWDNDTYCQSLFLLSI